MPDVFVWANVEARRLFTAKWTEAFKITPSSSQLHVFPDHILNIEACPNFLFDVLHMI